MINDVIYLTKWLQYFTMLAFYLEISVNYPPLVAILYCRHNLYNDTGHLSKKENVKTEGSS